MSLTQRTSLAAAAAGLGAVALLLAGRFEGTLATVMILALGVRAAGGIADGRDDTAIQALVVPAWAFAVAAAAFRAGSAALADVRGAHAVAGLAVARGPLLTVAGCVACVIGLAFAVASSAPEARASATAGARLAFLGVGAQIGVAVSAFGGPAVSEPVDAIAWVAGFVAVAVAAGALRASLPARTSALAANLLTALGFVLVLFGGRP